MLSLLFDTAPPLPIFFACRFRRFFFLFFDGFRCCHFVFASCRHAYTMDKRLPDV